MDPTPPIAAPPPWLDALARELVAAHQPLAILLYGSWARGAARAESDVDILIVVADTAPDGTPRKAERDARKIPGPAGAPVDLDAWVTPLAALDAEKDPSLLRLRGGRALHDPDGRIAPFLTGLEALQARGPEPLPDDERRALLLWAERMLRRIANPDPAQATYAAWRRAEFLTELLPDAFRFRGWWYPGPEPALRELATRDPELYRAFADALAPGAPHAAFAALVDAVLHP